MKRAKDNYQLTLDELENDAKQDVSKIAVSFQSLSWGDEKGANHVLKQARSGAGGYGLIFGSDVIYCKEVVKPLLETASILLDQNCTSKFFLSQSFAFDDDIENEMAEICATLGFTATVLVNTLDRDGGSKIQQVSRSNMV